MVNIILFSLCSSIMGFNPPGIKHDLSAWQKRKACSYFPIIKKAAKKYDIDPYLFTALILVESGFQKKVVSDKGACGLTQVLPRYTGGIANKKKYTCEQLKNPVTSIYTGAEILRYWIHVYGGGKERIGLCGYNAGYRCKKTKKRAAPSRGGMRYADKVLTLADYFRKASP